ncbi:hypothetical protein [Actinophytocola xanthii]|uniref:Uncharacterized protein n=1 Tax=Actinophytocola xanthii TaxID=1912961 RepID=A0A1Q8CXU8_9PSEU|nr:hypothetical protein [Actinophytocola xanthii]OLF19181.1 hypothetical protein BU204_02125 [Actinophytocola xanthii]
MHEDSLDDHPDLQRLRLSRKDQRRALAEARRTRRQARASSSGPSFARRHRTVLVSVVVLAAVVAVGALVVDQGRAQAGVDLARPFAGTPAADWSDGAAGIVPPEAAPVGPHPAAAVTDAYRRVRQVLVASRLDRAVLEGHDHARYLALLAPAARPQVGEELATPSEEAYTRVTRIADGFRLLSAQPKVRGEMSATPAADGTLLVRTNYVFVYAFEPADPDAVVRSEDILTVDRFEAEFRVAAGERWTPESRGVWPHSVRGFTYAAACDAFDRGELAPPYSDADRADPRQRAEDPATYFDPQVPIPTTSNCPAT